MSRPFVSVLMPTYNRRRFFESALMCYKHQTYPKDRMEWIIYDDGTDCIRDIVEEAQKTVPNIRYFYEPDKILIGAKRNKCMAVAKGDIQIWMDDDDYYPPERVAHVVTRMSAKPKVELAGSSEILMYYTDNHEIWRVGPYNPNHATNGTMAHRKSYAKKHKYDETVTHAEEKSFLDDYKHEMIQLDPMKTMLVISHARNTFDKRGLRATNNPFFKKTTLKVNNIIRNKKLRDILIWHDTAPDAKAMVTLEDSIAQNSMLPQNLEARPFVQNGDKVEYVDLPPDVKEYIQKQIAAKQAVQVQGENPGEQVFQCQLPPEMDARVKQHMAMQQQQQQQQQHMNGIDFNDLPDEVKEYIQKTCTPKPGQRPGEQVIECQLPPEMDAKVKQHMAIKQMKQQVQQMQQMQQQQATLKSAEELKNLFAQTQAETQAETETSDKSKEEKSGAHFTMDV